MLAKRIIPCLDVTDGRVVKGVNFLELRDAGDPVEIARRYDEQGADELTFLDITATVEKRKTLSELVNKIAHKINIPFTVGGGIKTAEKIEANCRAGATINVVGNAIEKSPSLILEMAQATKEAKSFVN